jgi:hypothetical protein
VSFHKHRSCRIGNRQVNDKRPISIFLLLFGLRGASLQ